MIRSPFKKSPKPGVSSGLWLIPHLYQCLQLAVLVLFLKPFLPVTSMLVLLRNECYPSAQQATVIIVLTVVTLNFLNRHTYNTITIIYSILFLVILCVCVCMHTCMCACMCVSVCLLPQFLRHRSSLRYNNDTDKLHAVGFRVS